MIVSMRSLPFGRRLPFGNGRLYLLSVNMQPWFRGPQENKVVGKVVSTERSSPFKAERRRRREEGKQFFIKTTEGFNLFHGDEREQD